MNDTPCANIIVSLRNQNHDREYDADQGDVIAGPHSKQGCVDADVGPSVRDGDRSAANDIAMPGGWLLVALQPSLACISAHLFFTPMATGANPRRLI